MPVFVVPKELIWESIATIPSFGKTIFAKSLLLTLVDLLLRAELFRCPRKSDSGFPCFSPVSDAHNGMKEGIRYPRRPCPGTVNLWSNSAHLGAKNDLTSLTWRQRAEVPADGSCCCFVLSTAIQGNKLQAVR